MSYIDGIAGWGCPICGAMNASRRVICRCGQSHRPTEFWAREIAEHRRALERARWLAFVGWSAFVVAALLAVVLGVLAFAGPKSSRKGAEAPSFPPVGMSSADSQEKKTGGAARWSAIGPRVRVCSGVENLFLRKGAKAQRGGGVSADNRTLQEVVRDALRSLSVDAGLELQTGAVVEALAKRLHRDEGQDVCIPHLIMERGELRFLSCSVEGAVERCIAEADAKECVEQNEPDLFSGVGK